MFVLEVISGPYRGQAIQLTKGEVVTIGRSPECTVQFDDEQLSGRHAEFDWSDGGFSVFDLGSTNGTTLNGRRIQGRSSLVLGDLLQVGATILQLADIDIETGDLSLIEKDRPERGQLLGLAPAKTQIAKSQRGKNVVNGPNLLALEDQKTAVRKSTAELKLDHQLVAAAARLKDVVEGGGQGARILVQREGRLDPFWSVPVTIGREQSSGVVLDDQGVSLRHAVIDHRDGRYLIRDVGSSNGTFRNGRRIVEETLEDGDVLSIGSYAILVVIGPSCLGLDLQPPSMTDSAAGPRRTSEASLGVIGRPLGDRAPTDVKRKKKASELIWYATSDLDRGSLRARTAIVSMVIGVIVTGWMLSSGSSEILAGNRISEPHETPVFTAQSVALGREQCTACHVGAGRTSTLRCLDCHPFNRPTRGHVVADVECLGCHIEHRGRAFRPAAAAVLQCNRCHEEPHENLSRVAPKMVAAFDIEARADVEFHLHHESNGVACLRCHDPETHSVQRGIRGACGQCHAPDHPDRRDCQLCHHLHPDRTKSSTVVVELPPIEEPPRFATKALLWAGGTLVLSFVVAALIPRKRRMVGRN